MMGREKEDAHYLPTRTNIVLECSTIRAIFGRPRRWQCGQYIPLVIKASWLINNISLWTSRLKQRKGAEPPLLVDSLPFFPSIPFISQGIKRARRERRRYNMDEEYDVIVLGTGLTVSSQASSSLHRNKKKRKKKWTCELPRSYFWADCRPVNPLFIREVKASLVLMSLK